jgi:hypothetical protein
MRTKKEILEEIRRTAKENAGTPLGLARFERETGIKPYDWKKYWARFGAAQEEAGYKPNQLQDAYAHDFLFEKVIGIMRKLGRFPTYDELSLERGNDSELPNRKVFTNFGPKQELIRKISEYAGGKSGYEDVVALCGPILEKTRKAEVGNEESIGVGAVYLFKSGRYYKIGKTNDTVRRGSELRIQLPEKTILVHEIKTDDPSGIEVYWHKRFESKRMNGEWFDLSSSDVKAFKRWRRIH